MNSFKECVCRKKDGELIMAKKKSYLGQSSFDLKSEMTQCAGIHFKKLFLEGNP